MSRGGHSVRRDERRPPHEWYWRIAALVAGALPILAFPSPALWWWAFVSLVPSTLLIARAPTRRTGVIRSWWVAAGYGIAAIYWTVPNVGPGVVLIGFFLGLLYLVWGWITWELLHGSPNPARVVGAVVLLPSAWLAAEYARSWSALGGPWAVLGASQWNDRTFLSLASLGGVWLVSLAIVAVNTGVAAAVVPTSSTASRLVGLSCAGVVLVAGFSFGAARTLPRSGYSLTVAMVQPGPGLAPLPRFNAEVRETASVAGKHPELVVWAETSVSYDLSTDHTLLDRLEHLSGQVGADILVNEDARVASKGGIYKSAILIDRSGIVSIYDKMRLVPFGEYIPFRPVLGWLSDISRAAKVNRRRGTHLVVMKLPDHLPPVGALICFEEAFPDMSRHLAAEDAQVIIYQTSDSTFEGSWELGQHASLAAVRAVESGRPAIQVALTGDSSAFTASGRELAWIPKTERGAFVVTLPLSLGTTFFVRWGDWAPDAALLLLVLAALVAIARHRRSKREPWRRPSLRLDKTS